MGQNRTLIERFLVLENDQLLVYKDSLAFKAFPEKPSIKITSNQVAEVKQI
jgi:hypothetical protein